MNKHEFLTQLRAKLWSLPETDKQRSVDYYGEMIDDRMEEGQTAEEALAAIGDLEKIVKDILEESPSVPVVTEAPKKRRTWEVWQIVLLVLGFPVWGSLLISVVAVAFSLWISLWSVVISLYAVAIALAASSVGCVFAGFFMIGGFPEVTVAWGAALVCAGLAILMFMLSNLAAKGMAALTKWTWNGIFHRKERTV